MKVTNGKEQGWRKNKKEKEAEKRKKKVIYSSAVSTGY